jgi:RNA polymerase sigma factor (sigma-70 family)
MSFDDDADRRIVSECVQFPDSEPAWQTFFIHFGLRMRIWIRMALPSDSPADHDDVYQNLMVKIFTGGILERIDPTFGNPHSYLMRVTFNYCMDEHRHDWSKPSSIDREELIADQTSLLANGFPPRTEDELLAALLQNVAEGGLDALTKDIYNAFLDEMPAAQVAETFGVSLATAYRYRAALLARARVALGLPAAEKKLPGD